MAATVEFSESNGPNAGEVVTNGISNINFGSSDSPNIVPASHPIIIGQFGYGKWIRFHVSAMGGSSNIADLRLYKSSGAYLAGESINSNLDTNVNLYRITLYAHRVAGGGGGLVVTPITDGGVASVGANVNPPAALPASENISIGGIVGGVLHAPGYSDYAFLALATTGATPAGPVNQKVFTIQYNET